MWVIFIEIGVALALVLTVLWATWPRRGHDADTPPASAAPDPAPGPAEQPPTLPPPGAAN